MLKYKKLVLFVAAALFAGALSSCGGGGSDGTDPSPKPPPQVTPSLPAGGIMGQFKDANVEGLEYRTSGGRTGVTDSEGMFICEEDGTVTFSIGGVEIGTSDCKLVVTPVDLVPGGSLDSAEVKNIVRFLLVVDEDADRSNGIKISESVRQAARDWNLDFDANNFAESIGSIVDDIAQIYEDDDRAITDEDEAKNHLQQTLQCSYSGVYTGTFSGDDRGRFGVLVDSRTGAITGVSYSTLYDEFSVQTGTRAIAPEHGGVTFNGSNSFGDGGFVGRFTSVDMITGSWSWEDPEDSDNEIDETGTFSGERIGSDRNAKYRVTGFWRNPSDSEDYGFFAFDVDGQGQLTGVGYSIGEDRLFPGDGGTASISLGSLEATAGGETIMGTLHPDGRFSGTATESGQATPSNLNGSWCQLNHGPDDSRPDDLGTADPDLVVQSPSVSDSSLDVGQSFTLSATVRNRGNSQSAATTLRYYRSSDTTISTEDAEVGTDAVDSLPASGASDESIELMVPSDAGTYYYGACVESVSGESDTGNNCSSAVLVHVGEPDTDNIHTGSDAITLTGSPQCSARQVFSTTVEVTMSGTVQAQRSVSFLTLTGYANGQWVGIDFLGSMSAGESEDFNIFGIISTSATTFRCLIEWEARLIR